MERFLIAAEHHKRGTTNPSNRNKHEEGQSRKKKDKFGEKGDARRKKNPNKRRRTVFAEYAEDVFDGIAGVVMITAGVVGVVYFIGNNVTGVGILDDSAIPACIPWILEGASKLNP